jgi:hypothetical protein
MGDNPEFELDVCMVVAVRNDVDVAGDIEVWLAYFRSRQVTAGRRALSVSLLGR